MDLEGRSREGGSFHSRSEVLLTFGRLDKQLCLGGVGPISNHKRVFMSYQSNLTDLGLDLD